jgi:two-component system CheB/CheR fusion protein
MAKKQPSGARKKAAVPAPPKKKVLSRVREKGAASGDEFFVVGIGSSAGGLEALEHFFLNMPPDSGMAFVLIPHLDPTHKSILPELLKRFTAMPISEAKDGMAIGPNSVYVLPPNKDMAILNGKLQLLVPAESRGLRHPIDFFFRSLAQDQRDRAVAVILSGTGTEGALGIKSIKGEDGLIIVQDPKDAKYDGMPASAIATGLVDFVLPAAKIPDHLLGFIRRIIKRPETPAATPEEKRVDPLQKIFVLIRARTGHDLSLYKQTTILRRIERRTAIHQIKGLADYVTYLRHNPQEIDILFKEILIRVTNFFRTVRPSMPSRRTCCRSSQKKSPSTTPCVSGSPDVRPGKKHIPWRSSSMNICRKRSSTSGSRYSGPTSTPRRSMPPVSAPMRKTSRSM